MGCDNAASARRGPDSSQSSRCFVGRLLWVGSGAGDGGNALQLLQDGIVAGHKLLTVSQPIRPAVPRLHAAKKIIGIGEPVEVLPRPERGADLGLHIEVGGDGRLRHCRQAGQPLQRRIAIPARPLRPATADIGGAVRRAGPIAHAVAVNVVKSLLLPAGRLAVFGNDLARIGDQVSLGVAPFVEPVRPDLSHPGRGVPDVLGQVRNGEPAALVLDIGKEIRQPGLRRIDPRLGQHVLFGCKSIDHRLRGAREDPAEIRGR